MKKTIVALGASTIMLLVNVMPVLANDVETHLDAAKAATVDAVNHLDLARQSTTAAAVDTHTDEALELLPTVKSELDQAGDSSIEWGLLVKLRLVNNTLERADNLTQLTLEAPNMRKWSRALIASSYGHILLNLVNGL